ncbi:MAG: DUF6615 family protein [Nostoc sp.]|uniref:DUF6615 family protein n=1 Tax=Nostoc sp. TaxID=1180 RepID=UPI002FF9372B
MNAVDVFENIASSTWQRIYLGEVYHVSQGEETITDSNLLEIAKANCPEVRVIKTPKNKEKEKGTDWEWWIGNNRLGWLRYAVQAKKINPGTTRYDKLKHKHVDNTLQIDMLEKYAKENGAIPLYCFYNYLENVDLGSWQCNLFYENEQFGCTVTPSKNVRLALSKKGSRKFADLHKLDHAKPLRCLVRCPLMLQIYQTGSANSTSLGFENVTVYSELPRQFVSALETGNLNEFSSDFYNQDLGVYPKRILVANYVTEENV